MSAMKKLLFVVLSATLFTSCLKSKQTCMCTDSYGNMVYNDDIKLKTKKSAQNTCAGMEAELSGIYKLGVKCSVLTEK